MSFYEKYFIKSQLLAYVISMDKPKELFKKLKQENIKPILFEAVNGKKLTQKEKNKYCDIFFAYFGNDATIGIAISHYKIWEKIATDKNPYTIVFEDDVILEPNFYDRFNNIIKKVPDNFDIFYLGCFYCQNNHNIMSFIGNISGYGNPNGKHINEHINQPSLALGTHAYVISKKGAKKLVNYFKNKLYNHIDFSLQMLINSGELIVYSPYKRLAYQTSTDDLKSSNLSNPHPILLTKLVSYIPVDKKVNLGYVMTVNICKIGNFNLTLFSISFFLLGMYLGNKKENSINNITEISLLFFLLSIPDLIINKNNNSILVHYFLFIIPFLFFKKTNI
jgi:GR25 family glycosyltransferase involved in LPS biosynthesis